MVHLGISEQGRSHQLARPLESKIQIDTVDVRFGCDYPSCGVSRAAKLAAENKEGFIRDTNACVF